MLRALGMGYKIIAAGVLVLVVVAAVGVWFFTSEHTISVPDSVPALVSSSVATSLATATSTSGQEIQVGYREYQNARYHFSLLYPGYLSVKEFSEAEGGSTITFEDISEGKGFQVFIVPFPGKQVSEARFKEDIPSGVRVNLTNITLDGATGAAFYSTSEALGDTREVWLIKNGFLYEVTTFKELDTWLDAVLQTWHFL